MQNSDDGYPDLPTDPVTSPEAQVVAQLTDALRQIREVRTRLDGHEAAAAHAAADVLDLEKRLDVAEVQHRVLTETAGRSAHDLYVEAAAVPETLLPLWRRVRDSGPAPAIDTAKPPTAGELSGSRQRVSQLGRTLGERRARLAAHTAALDGDKALIDRLQSESDALRKQVDASVQTALNGTQAAEAGSYAGGRLGRPVVGSLTSPFGDRFDPYYHRWQLHAGVDIAAPMQTPITAAAAGRVTQAGPLGGYGNFTCVEHGTFQRQRLTTCYAHQSRILVTPGQQVAAGQLIGLVGSTGASTGPHLHFEVRLGGRAVNPLPWLN